MRILNLFGGIGGNRKLWRGHEITAVEKEGKKCLHAWLDIHFDDIIYLGSSHCPAQILRNAVHPQIGLWILNESIRLKQ